jgi:hypothetical protein
MAIVICSCPTCNDTTPHRTGGVDSSSPEPDGRVSQSMTCTICNTMTKVPFTEGTTEFQDNLDAPDGSSG